SKLPIRLLELRFPSAEVGLPEGCENADALPAPELGKNFFTATSMLQQQFEQSLGEMEPIPCCIISDFCLPWTAETARKFDIPRIIFHGMGSFSLLCSLNILRYKVHDSVASGSESYKVQDSVVSGSESDSEPVIVPGLPDEYQKAKQNKAWCIGPVSLFNKETLDIFERGNKASVAENECVKWLDARQPSSVIYVCLGSLCRLVPAQIKEIGLGLEG
ncbi:Udp-glycosyltransferase 73c5, partial [Thalictrum thalictroides]